ncbi:UNVERIFIED_CONTAM: hypothetical protein RMT77_002609 [Armadillidium vulgare]
MYVRQGDTENRPTRASAFNVRRTIEKRQIQQERRERKALREQIREHLRSLSEGRERRESSSCSSISSTSQGSSSVRSKSLNSLDQDLEDSRSESPLFKVQSSPTLESEKEGIRSYLFGSNLSDSSIIRSSLLVSRIMSPTFSDASRSETRNSLEELGKKDADKQIPKLCSHSKSASEHLNYFSQNNNETSHELNKKHSLSNTASINTGSSLNNILDTNNILNNIRKNYISDKNSEKGISFCKDKVIQDSQDASQLPKTNQEENSPVPPPRRRSRVSRSTGQLTVEKDDKPAWLRLAKERRSLRGTKTNSDISDRASSIITPEPEWVTKARKRLESLNVCLTSTTDTVSVNSQITESSAWSRGGLDALEDLREEVNRISEELADEATERVEKELGIMDRVKSTNMIEYNTSTANRDSSVEKQRVSFDGTVLQNEKTRKNSVQNLPKDEVRFGDLKHDWGGVKLKSTRILNGVHKETRFGKTEFSEETNICNSNEETQDCDSPSHESRDSKEATSCDASNLQNDDLAKIILKNEKLPVMHFGDTPQDIFTKSTSKVKSQSSSKFESIPGPDPTKMTAEELNQNVEEYDFPIPTGKEDATELIKFLKESLNKQEKVPEFISNEDCKPKPKGILKRKSTENVFQDIKIDECSKNSRQSIIPDVNEEATKLDGDSRDVACAQSDKCSLSATVGSSKDQETSGVKVYTFSFNPYQNNSDIKQANTFQYNSKSEDLKALTGQHYNDSKEKTETTKHSYVFRNTSPVRNGKSSLDSDNKNLTQNVHENGVETHYRRDDLFGRRSLREQSSKVREVINPASYIKRNDVPTNSKTSNLAFQSVKKSPDFKKKEIFHHAPTEVHLEIVDTTRRSLPSSLEKRIQKNSLFEWEAIQRQRLEDEEKNKLNKTLSIKPVSSKIKDLVKIHSSIVASMFSKDKKDYNGTVDAKEEIFFQKIPNNSKPNNVPIKQGLNNEMKSPFIVKNIENPILNMEKEIPKHKIHINENKKDAKNITPSLEREAYMFNQRNIYIDDDSIQKQRTKEKRTRIENIQSLVVGRKAKKYELDDNKRDSSYIIQSNSEGNQYMPKKHSDPKDTYNAKYVYKEKEKINNYLNNLSNERSNSLKNDAKIIENDEANDFKRTSVYRRTFHECLPRKESTNEVEKVPKTQENSNYKGSNFNRDECKRLYVKNSSKGRGPVNLIQIIGDTPSASSSNVSTPITSPRASPERRFYKDGEKMSAILESRRYISLETEKENVRPVENKPYGEYENKNVYYFGSSSDQRSPSSITEKKLIERADPNRRSLSKLLTAWEERAMRERSSSPAALSDSTVNFYNFKKDQDIDNSITVRHHRERTQSLRSTSSVRSTPDRESRPVSLSSILERDVLSPYSSSHKLSEELKELTKIYRKEKAKRLSESESEKEKFESKPNFLYGMTDEKIIYPKDSQFNEQKSYSTSTSKPSSSPKNKRHSQKDGKKIYSTSKTIKKQVKESHIYNDMSKDHKPLKESKVTIKKTEFRPSVLTKNTTNDASKAKSKVVRRKSSLKRSQSGDSSSLSSFKRDCRRDSKRDSKQDPKREKLHAKKSKDSDTASERYESIKQKADGSWTKTCVRKVKLSKDNTDKIISSRDKSKPFQDKHFKLDASRELEKWAAGMKIEGKLVKKEGQKYSHHVEEEIEGGKKSSKAVTHRVVRRGSRRLAKGGEIVSETKEMTSGDPSGRSSTQAQDKDKALVLSSATSSDPTSRKLKSSTDGERYVTQSIINDGGIHKFTTEGVDNKTTKTVEVIGGNGWEGERAVKGHHGERLVVEHSLGAGGRPSTVVKKSTSQSKFIITKTKKKA